MMPNPRIEISSSKKALMIIIPPKKYSVSIGHLKALLTGKNKYQYITELTKMKPRKP